MGKIGNRMDDGTGINELYFINLFKILYGIEMKIQRIYSFIFFLSDECLFGIENE
jgi:hypothetical protein